MAVFCAPKPYILLYIGCGAFNPFTIRWCAGALRAASRTYRPLQSPSARRVSVRHVAWDQTTPSPSEDTSPRRDRTPSRRGLRAPLARYGRGYDSNRQLLQGA